MIKKLEPEDFYKENGYVVFTEAYLMKRGQCCGCGCRHCPYTVEAATPTECAVIPDHANPSTPSLPAKTDS